MDNKIIFILLFSIVVLTSFISASSVIVTSTGANSLSANNSVVKVFNISITNTGASALYNISMVNITLPSTFIFQPSTNGTNATSSVFTNTSTRLSWNKTIDLIGGTSGANFWFNVSASTPGSYNINITIYNASDSAAMNSTNITVLVNDTTNPIATMEAFPVDMYNGSSSNVVFGLSCSDNYNVSEVWLYGNWSGSWAANASNQTPYNNTIWNTTVTGLADGVYKWGVYCNGSHGLYTANNSDWSNANRTIIIDTVAPTVTITCSPTSLNTGNTVTCSCSGTDSTSGFNSLTLSYTASPSTSSTGVFTQSCSGSDYSGNSGSGTSGNYIVESGGSSSGSGSSSTISFWTAGLYVASEDQFFEGFTREMPAKQRVKLVINEEDHYVGVVSLTSSSVTINVSSTTQQATFNIGDEKKFEVTGDGYYDLLVKLNGIVGSKANVTISSIKELIPKTQTPSSVTQETPSDTDTSGTDTEDETTVLERKNNLWMWVVGVVLLIIVGFLFYINKKKE